MNLNLTAINQDTKQYSIKYQIIEETTCIAKENKLEQGQNLGENEQVQNSLKLVGKNIK